ncbi:MAG TPA: 6-phosphogluconolactonase [Solirubrobacteraceae bacterium]|nr:6-phosphogluconolactonase [Solirubrobacteraceae bacterium]
MTDVVVLPDAEAAAVRLADQLASRLADTRRDDGVFHLALAGGDTPRRAYELLGEMEIAWDHAHVWLVDERCVPRDDPQSNARMIDRSLFAHAGAGPPRLHPVDGEALPEDAAWLYARELDVHVPDGVLDMVVLGVGEDGHIGSLFAHHPLLEAHHVPCAAIHDSPKPPARRVTLTLPWLRAARHTVLLADGAAKRDALHRALGQPDPATPASLLGDGLNEVICDAAADPR